MQRIIVTSGKALLQSILIVCLMLVFSLMAWTFGIQQPSYAITSQTNQLTPEEKIDRAYEYNRAAGIREEERQEAYEQAIKESENPQKTYERNLKAYKQENPQPNLIEKAEELVEKVTGQ